MYNANLGELPIIPEEYAHTFSEYSALNFSQLDSKMLPEERAFIYGLLKYYHPQNVLELGVWTGGDGKHFVSHGR